MIKPLILIAALAIPASGGSLKDSPSHDPSAREGVRDFWQRLDQPVVAVPAKAPYLRVKGIDAPFRVPQAVLQTYKLKPGQTISRDLARHILRSQGTDYPEEIIQDLRRLDRDQPAE